MSDANTAIRIASQFLKAQAALDFESAKALACEEYVVVGPGGRETGLEAVFERLRTTYRSLGKIPIAQDVSEIGGAWAIYTRGTMVGERANGMTFEGIRFLDLIVVRNDRVERQEIWNDFGQPGVG